MSGWWYGLMKLRPRVGDDAQHRNHVALQLPRGNWIVTQLPPTVEPQSFREGRDLAAMAHVEGWR